MKNKDEMQKNLKQDIEKYNVDWMGISDIQKNIIGIQNDDR